MDHRHDYDISARDAHLAGLLTRRHYHHRMSRSEKADLVAQLAAHPLLAGWPESDIRQLLSASHAFSYPANWTISAQSSCSDICFLILEGEVALTHNHQQERVVGSGDVIGLADAAHHHVHHEAAVSRTRVTGVAVDSEPLLAALGARSAAPRRDEVPTTGWSPLRPAFS